MRIKKHLTYYLLALILFGGFVIRLYGFTEPLADWHSWRQVDTSAVSRNFVKQGFDVLHPRYDDISNVQTGVDNPEGYRFVEFPLYNLFQAGYYQLVGIFTLEQWGRLVSIFSSVLAALFLYLLISRHSNKTLGLLSAFFYMFIPYNIYYGRTVLPDTTMVTAVLGGIYFFDKWVEDKSKIRSQKSKVQFKNQKLLYYLLAILFTSAAFLLKPYALFFVLPMLVLAYERWGWALFKQWQLYVFVILAAAPLAWWRWWIMQYPEGVPANLWLLNGNGIRFRPAFFRWIFYERLTKLIAGYLGIIILAYSILSVWKMKDKWFFLAFLLSSLFYITVFATGNVQHDYYQILIMPSIAIFLAIGSYYLYHWKFKKLPAGKIILTLSLISLFWFGWQQVKDYFNINNRAIITAGKAVDELTPRDALILAPRMGDTTLLYYTNRKGWPHNQAPIPELIKKGADYLVYINPSPEDIKSGAQYKILKQTNEFVIFDLHNKQ